MEGPGHKDDTGPPCALYTTKFKKVSGIPDFNEIMQISLCPIK